MSTDLIAAARRIATGEWTVGPEGPVEVDTNPHLAELVRAGYAHLHYVSANQQVAGRDDHWVLTPEGEAWLARNDTVCGESYDHDLALIDERDGMATYECRECGAEVIDEEEA